MPTTIDSLQIEIQSNSTSASAGIRDLAKSLGELKKSGTVTTAIKNLDKLSTSLRGFANASHATSSIGKLAGALDRLKNIGSVGSIANSISKLGASLQSVGKVDIDSVAPKIQRIATALQPLSAVKAGGINTMVNGLSKLGKVTDSLDDKTIDAFAEKIKKLNTVLEPLSTKMTTIQTGLRGINSKARSAGSSVKQMGDDVNVAAVNFSAITHAIQTVYHWLQQAIQKFSEFMNQAIEWDGIAARFGRGFGGQAQETYDWIKRLNEEMGINVQQFMQYSSIYATMLTGFGVATEDATKMALGYTELTYDIWAGYNDVYKRFEDASDAVKSAIAGEVEPIRRAGFTIVESTLKQTAANYGLNISLEKATEAQKSYLRYLALVDQAHAQNLVGTYAKELTTAEGLMRTFSQQVKSLTQAFGSLFLPILTKVMPYLQAFVELLEDGVRALAGLFGFEIQKVDWSGYGDGSDVLDDVAGSAGGVSDSLKDATKAAKELKNATIGIDELNVISPPTASSSGAGGGAGGGAGFDGLDVDSLWDDSIFDSVKSKVSDIVKKMKEWLGLTEPINSWADFFETRLGRILTVVGLVGGGIAAWKLTKSFLSGIELLSKILSKPSHSIGLGLVLTVTGFSISFTGMKDAIKNGLDGFNFGEIVLGNLTGAGGSAVLGAGIAAWISKTFAGSAIAEALATAGANLGLGTAGAVGAALGAAFAAIILGIPTMFVGIYDAITDEMDWLNGILITGGATATGAGIGAIIGAIGGPIGAGAGALIGLKVGLIIDQILLLREHWDEITAFFSKFFNETLPGWWNKFTTWLSGVPDAVGKYLASVPDRITKWFDDLWQPIKDFDWKGLGYDIGHWFGSAINDAIVFVTETVPNWFSKVWNKIEDSFRVFFKEKLPRFFKETLPKVITDIVAWFEELPEKIDAAMTAAKAWFVDVGEAIIDGIMEGFSTIGTAIKDFVNGFVQGFKDALGIKSPSKVFKEIGKYCLDGLLGSLSPSAIKERVIAMWNQAKTWWEKTKGTLKTYTPTIGNIRDKLSAAWTTARNWWTSKKAALSTYTPSIGNIRDRVSSAWSTARTWWNSKKAAMSTYTPSIGSIKDRLVSAWNTAKKWWNANVKLSIPSLSFKVTYSNSGLNTVQKAVVKALGMSGWPKLSFAANGGIFDQGSLVWAGERGAEIVANAGGGKTGVMNVQQMQDAVYDGVYAAVVAAMRASSGGNGSQAVNVYLDGRQITAAVEQRQRERGVSIMGSQVYSY